MSTWKIFSDADNKFRWEIIAQDSKIKRKDEFLGHEIEYSSDSRLPSMSDLLLQGCTKFLDDRSGGIARAAAGGENSFMFQTGSGNTVAVKQSSIAKALSLIGEDNDIDAGTLFPASTGYTGKMFSSNDGRGFSGSLFQTGAGNSVNISSAGLVRANALLGSEEDDSSFTFSGLEPTGKPPASKEHDGWSNSSHFETKVGVNGFGFEKQSGVNSVAFKTPPIKFHTAGGRSLSVSIDALQRARSLLGDPELGMFINEGDAVGNPVRSDYKDTRYSANCLSKETNSFSHQGIENNNSTSKSFTSPLRPSSNRLRLPIISENRNIGTNLLKKFEAEKYNAPGRSANDLFCQKNNLNGLQKSRDVDIGPKTHKPEILFRKPLADLSNSTITDLSNKKGEKRRIGGYSIASFKRPRSSRFSTPMKSNITGIYNGMASVTSQNSCYKGKVSIKYPFQVPRKYVKEYFGVAPFIKHTLEHLPDQVRCMDPHNAEMHKFSDGSGSSWIEIEHLCHLLDHSGASTQYVTKEWVANHYKWIVWKLACYDRCFPSKSTGEFLSLSNVLEELKYRYEREVNHGHRSSIKRILEGDAPPSSMVTLCISAIHSNNDSKVEIETTPSKGDENTSSTKVELTDGWYAIDAFLDGLLSKKLAAGKLFVGQKLRIWGAGLSGWVGPVSPLEVLRVSRTASLLLHMNGTYRAHWADRLGLCNGIAAPLAFKCIKSTGGPIPQTVVGVTRIYPVLYKEKLTSGVSIVRSERSQTKMLQLNNQRRSSVIEGIVSEFQMEGTCNNHDSDSEDGAKILKMLETAAEPELIMAEMTSEQLTSFASYQAKLAALKQSDMQKSVEKALEEAGLGEREVTPFMRVRVTGLTSKTNKGKECPKEGLITMWDPTEKQRSELVEGKAYTIAGLVPLKFDSEIIYLQGRGSSTKWRPLSPLSSGQFQPFFTPRTSVLLSNLGQVPLSSEFDIAALVVHVGEAYTAARQKRQWVFVTDNSISELQPEELSNSLLAISFCSPYTDDNSYSPISYKLTGSTVAFCNLIKRAKDQMNHLWVAEATENSIYFVNYDFPHLSHLKNAAASVQRWEKSSGLIIEKLTNKVLSIISNSKC